MKKYLLIYNDMRIGGIEKSIVSLLNSIDYAEVSVDLLLLRAEGDFLSQIPKQVNIIDCKFYYDFSRSVSHFFSKVPSWKWRARKIFYALVVRASKIGMIYKGAEVAYQASLVPRTKKMYDVAIAFVDWSFDYAIQYVKADRKYYYIHVDYETCIGLPEKDRRIFPLFDAGFTVSEDSSEVLKSVFPQCKDKIHVWPNIIPKEFLQKLAVQGESFSDGFNGIRLLTVCRASYEKGVDIAIDACVAVKEKKLKFRWYYLGTGGLINELKKRAEEKGVQENFIFLGEKSNPYGFFRDCDIYVQCSRSEGYGITLAEAAVFGKPRVVSDLQVFREQILDQENGILTKIEPEKFAEQLEKLMEDRVYYSKIVSGTEKVSYENSKALTTFYAL